MNKEIYSGDTSDFDFRHNAEYKAGKVLQYKTKTPYGNDIVLTQDYLFKWDIVEDYYFLKVKV